MASMSLATRDAFRADLCTVEASVRAGVDPEYQNTKDGHWILWTKYCDSTGIDPYLTDIQDPVPYIQVFALRYGDGRLAPRGKPVKSAAVSNVLTSVGQGFTRVGSADPRKDSFGNTDFRLQRQVRSLSKNIPLDPFVLAVRWLYSQAAAMTT